ncbi:hypothetical protein Pfo_017665 [Paulownia fortunei]|nr:hypothetical protein Pfo_017665 [Paulownia fortunei]
MANRIHPGDLVLPRYPQQLELTLNPEQSPHSHTRTTSRQPPDANRCPSATPTVFPVCPSISYQHNPQQYNPPSPTSSMQLPHTAAAQGCTTAQPAVIAAKPPCKPLQISVKFNVQKYLILTIFGLIFFFQIYLFNNQIKF